MKTTPHEHDSRWLRLQLSRLPNVLSARRGYGSAHGQISHLGARHSSLTRYALITYQARETYRSIRDLLSCKTPF